jgi:PDZ domain
MPSAFSWSVLVPSALRATAPVNLGVRHHMKKLRIALIVALVVLPGFAKAQFSPEPLMALGFIAAKSQCAKSFASMRSDLDVAFDAFIKKNNKFLNADMWRQLDSSSFPLTAEFNEAACKTYLQDLPTADFDKLVELTRRETECHNKVDAIAERLGSQRPRIGIILGAKSRTPTIQAVEPGSPAAQSGLRPGDLIREVGSASITTQCDVALAVMELKPRESVVFSVARGDSVLKIKVVPIAGAE